MKKIFEKHNIYYKNKNIATIIISEKKTRECKKNIFGSPKEVKDVITSRSYCGGMQAEMICSSFLMSGIDFEENEEKNILWIAKECLGKALSIGLTARYEVFSVSSIEQVREGYYLEYENFPYFKCIIFPVLNNSYLIGYTVSLKENNRNENRNDRNTKILLNWKKSVVGRENRNPILHGV